MSVTMSAKSVLILLLVALVPVLAGCSANDDGSSAALAKVEVYSPDDTLLTTIEDEDILRRFAREAASRADESVEDAQLQGALRQGMKDHRIVYRFVSYRSPVAVFNDGEPETLTELTVFADSHVVAERIDPDAIKNFPVSAENLTYYTEVSAETIGFLLSLGGDIDAS